jgi:PAS domain S-box-containing protein
MQDKFTPEDRTKFELSPQAQTAELQQLYDLAPCGYHSLDRDGMYVRINQTELNMLGYERSEIVGKMRFFDLLTPDSQLKFHANFSEFQRRGFVKDLEFEAIRKDGSTLPVSLSSTVITDDAGNYLMSRSIVIDISDRKRGEAERQAIASELQKSQYFVEQIVRTVPYIISVFNVEAATMVYINRSLGEMLGYSSNQSAAMGDRIIDLLHHPDETHPMQLALPSIATIRDGEIREFEHRMLHADGGWRWLQVRYASFSRHPDGRVERVLSIVHDITAAKQTQLELQHTEDRLRYLLTANPAVIYACDAVGDNVATFVSDNIATMLGYQPQSAIGVRDFWSSRIHDDDRERVVAEFTQLFDRGWHVHEYRFLHQNGNYVWIRDELRLIRDAAGNPLEFIGCWSDITDRKQLEAQFFRAQRLESLGTLASGIAHDLNNILTPILGIVEILPLQFPNLDHRTENLLTILNDSTRRGADLVKQILSFTRGVEGKPTCIQVHHLIKEIQRIVQQAFPKNIEAVFDYSQHLWTIEADSTLIHQVLMNLCVNARDAMPNGGMLTVSTENLTIDANYARIHLDAHPGDYIIISVADTGTGIAPETIERVFDPFFTTKEVGKGTGLGLSTSMAIITSHGGFINVYSEVDRGTWFKVYLPATANHEVTPQLPLLHLARGSNELILVVDDETSIRSITATTLETYNYRVLTAGDGIEAIATYAEHKHDIDVILLDLMMPSLDSVTTVRTLHTLDPSVRIIAMSGLSTNEQMTKMLRDKGVCTFLAKPFTTEELLKTLERVCTQ